MRTASNSGAEISKREESTLQERQPWWLVVLWAVSGVGVDCYCAFEWFSGRYPFYSAHVLRLLGILTLGYGICAFLAVRLVGARLRDIAAFFLFMSLTISGAMLVHWAGSR
jgi:hypothetical protein